jgi:serine O-acetyltransferase
MQDPSMQGARRMPSRSAVAGLLDSAKELFFPGSTDDETGPEDSLDQATRLSRFETALSAQIERAVACRNARDERPDDRVSDRVSDGESDPDVLAHLAVAQFPDLQEHLWSDVEAAYDGDPSLHSLDEAILCYPGITAMLCYRLAHLLHTLQIPLIPRMMTEYAHSRTGIDIHPGAHIGERLFIDHGTGVVIGETAVIGDRVRLYQGVTLGAKSFTTTPDGRLVKGEPRHPVLEDDVVIYSGASILGRITIGHGSVIGGNVWITRDVPPGSLVTQARGESRGFSNGSGI